MKKILLGLVAAACLASFAVPALAEDAPAGGDAPKAEKKGGKKKKAKKGEGDAAPAAGDDAAKK